MSRRQKYCICRKSHSNGAMVCCDKCLEWYHCKCIKVTQEEVEAIDPWFCKKCLEQARRCGNPVCNKEAESGRKYCSDDCCKEYNKERYHRLFLSKWKQLEKRHSKARSEKLFEMERLETERKKAKDLKKKLKLERRELEKSIEAVKEHARVLGAEANKEQHGDDSDDDDEEENIISDLTKSFCPSCGTEPTADKFFKHLTTCYKKLEGSFVSYSVTAMEKPKGVYCTKMIDKKQGWYCPNIAIICPAHNQSDSKDEICAAPLKDFQDTIELDGNYCLKLKKDCTLHYNWEKFRLATKDSAIIEAYLKQQTLFYEISRLQYSLNETYGGVLGVLLHNTVDHVEMDDLDDQEMIDVESPNEQ